MSDATIAAALKAALSAAAATFSPAIPLAWANRDYQPDGDRFLQVDILPAPNERLTIGGRHRKSGTVAVTVASLTNKGTGQALGIASALAGQFAADTVLTTSDALRIRVTAEPSIRQGFEDGGWWRTPVTIPFEVI